MSVTDAKHMGWVKLHTSMLGDEDLLECSPNARLLAVLVILWSADQNSAGVVPAAGRRVNRFCHFEGGAKAATAAIDELLECGYLVPNEDDADTLLIRSFRRYQANTGAEKSKNNRVGAFKQHHNAGKHTAAVAGCPLCAAGPVVKPDADDAPPPPEDVAVQRVTEDEGLFEEPEKVTTPGKRTATMCRNDFVGTFDEVFAVMPRLDAYRYLMTMAEELAAANEGLSKNLRGNLMNALLSNALEHYMGEFFTDPKQYTRAHRAAKALNDRDGYWWWLLAAQSSAAADINGDAVSYLTRTAANKRTDYLEGKAA